VTRRTGRVTLRPEKGVSRPVPLWILGNGVHFHSAVCRQIVKVDGIQERLYRVQVTINDGRWRAGIPIFEHPAPEMITDWPAVLNRIKHLKSEAQLP
jgi:hypothetical protein